MTAIQLGWLFSVPWNSQLALLTTQKVNLYKTSQLPLLGPDTELTGCASLVQSTSSSFLVLMQRMQLMSCLIKSYEERMFARLLCELLYMRGKAAKPVNPSELPPSRAVCMLTFNNALFPWWSSSNFKIFFNDIFCSVSITMTFPHHCRPNLCLVVQLAPSTKFLRGLSWGSATPLPVEMATGTGARPACILPVSKGKGRAGQHHDCGGTHQALRAGRRLKLEGLSTDGVAWPRDQRQV